MNYKHGISSDNTKIPDPVTRMENNSIRGYCNICEGWIELNTKNSNAKFGWYKHYQKMHISKNKENSGSGKKSRKEQRKTGNLKTSFYMGYK